MTLRRAVAELTDRNKELSSELEEANNKVQHGEILRVELDALKKSFEEAKRRHSESETSLVSKTLQYIHRLPQRQRDFNAKMLSILPNPVKYFFGFGLNCLEIGIVYTGIVFSNTVLLSSRALKSREARMLTPAMGAAMISPMYSVRENGAQHGFHGFHLRVSTLQGSTLNPVAAI